MTHVTPYPVMTEEYLKPLCNDRHLRYTDENFTDFQTLLLNIWILLRYLPQMILLTKYHL